MSKKITKPKTKDRELTEAKLLEAAEKVFSKEGFKGATTRVIAKEADTNLALINRYFNGKYGLLLALVDNKNKQFKARSYTPQNNLEDEIVCFAETFFERMTENTQFFKIVVCQYLSDAKFLKKFRDIISKHEDECILSEHFTRYIESGQIKDMPHLIQILDTIKTQAFGLIMVEVIVREKSLSEVARLYSDFVRGYAKSIVNSK